MKIKDIFYTNNHEISVYFVWFYIIFLILGGWVVNNFFQIEELFVIVLLLPLLGLIFYSDKKTKKFTNDNFPIFLELKKLPQTFISLKQQEIFLNEFAWNTTIKYDKNAKKYAFPESLEIDGIKIFYSQELERIEKERKILEESPSEEIIFQKRLITLYKSVSEWKNEDFISGKEREIVKIFSIQKWQKFLETFTILMIVFLFFDTYLRLIDGIFGYIFAILIIILLSIFFQKNFQIFAYLSKNFDDARDFLYAYFEKFKTQNPHPADIMIFADVINYFSENILQRQKMLTKNEKAVRKNYSFLFFHFQIPDEIQNFFREEKIKLKNDAEIVQKIIQKWSEMEKFRLEKERESSQNPLILASNKRREIMLRNLENINKNL